MRNLSNKELEFIANCDKVMEEEVVRPSKTSKKTLNDKFADVSYELNSYSVSKDSIIRDIHSIAYIWSKDESKETINEVITSYCPIKMSKHDVSLLIDSALQDV